MHFAISLWHAWESLLALLLLLALLAIGFGILLQALTLSHAAKYGAVSAGLFIVLSLIPQVLAHLWSSMTVWEHVVVLVGLVLFILIKRNNRHQTHSRKGGEQ